MKVVVERVDALAIGAGVMGLAEAHTLSLAGREVLAREAAIGTDTGSHNSEVVHAGTHHNAGSLKARLSVRGRQALYAYFWSA